MKICKKCGIKMHRAYHFEPGRIVKYYRCPSCLYTGRITRTNVRDLCNDKAFLFGKGE